MHFEYNSLIRMSVERVENGKFIAVLRRIDLTLQITADFLLYLIIYYENSMSSKVN